MGSFSYNEKTALELLAKHRLNELLLELAKVSCNIIFMSGFNFLVT